MPRLDPVALEIGWNRLISIANEQVAALIRASFTTIVRETEDLSCGIFDRRGRMVVQGVTGTPGHINTMAVGVRKMLERYPLDTLAPGDMLITNDPWLMSGHKHDITVAGPVFHRGRAVALTASTCHVADIGGRVLSAEGRDVFEEGLAIPVMKLDEGGVRSQPLVDLIAANVRVPDLVLGDIEAQVVSNLVSGEKLAAYLGSVGADEIEALAEAILATSDAAMRRALAALPDGTYRHTIHLDGVDEPVTIACAVTMAGETITIDYTGTSPQSPYGINVVWNYANAYSAYAVKCVTVPHVPNNEGCFRAVQVVAPEGCLVNARFPAPVAARHVVGHFLPNVVWGALAEVLADRVPAESSAAALMQFTGSGGDGPPFVASYFASGGMGARPTADGLSATPCPMNHSNTPVEVMEQIAPLLFREKALIPDSAGAGSYRGGYGQRVVVEVERPCVLSGLFERTRVAARGSRGGGAGRLAEIRVGPTRVHPKKGSALTPGVPLTVDLAGGGGHGPADLRDPSAVLADVAEGLLSPERATDDYGVVIDRERLAVDEPATAVLRSRRAQEKSR